MAASRKGRTRGGRRRGSPPGQALELDLIRRNLARVQREELVEELEEVLERMPRIARRRYADRQAALRIAAGGLLGWGALIAERGPDRLVERLFSAACVLESPCSVWWRGLVASGQESALAAHVARRIRDLDGLAPNGADDRRLQQARAEALPRLRALADRIDARAVEAADLASGAADLLVAGLAEDPEPGLQTEGDLYCGTALWLLEAELPVVDADSIENLREGLRLFEEQLPAMLEHARAHFEDPSLHGDDEEDDDDEEDQDDVDLDRGLEMIDDMLSVTDNPDEAAAIVNLAALMLTARSSESLAEQPLELSVEARLIGAGLTLAREDEETVAGLAAGDVTDESREEVRQVLLRAAGLLESDGSPPAPATADADQHLRRLDVLIDSLRDAAGEEDSVLGGLGLAAATVEVLRIGVDLGAGTAGCRAALVRSLAVLDPSSLAVSRGERRRAARDLRGLAEQLDTD